MSWLTLINVTADQVHQEHHGYTHSINIASDIVIMWFFIII